MHNEYIFCCTNAFVKHEDLLKPNSHVASGWLMFTLCLLTIRDELHVVLSSNASQQPFYMNILMVVSLIILITVNSVANINSVTYLGQDYTMAYNIHYHAKEIVWNASCI